MSSKRQKSTACRDFTETVVVGAERDIEPMETLLNKSELTEEDAERIRHEIKARVRKRFSR